MSRETQHALWDVEDHDNMPHVRDMTISAVTTRDVDEFCHRYHYAAAGGSMLWRYGLWHGAVLLGVCAYNLPTPEACESVFGREHGREHVIHMGRLSMADKSPPNSESRLIGASLKLLAAEHPEVWAVLTYAAESAGHLGYVYQATNAIYTGTGGAPIYYLDEQGVRHSNSHTNAAQAAEKRWTRHQDLPKHRYVYLLGNKAERRARRALLKLDVLPYPKRVNAPTVSDPF